MPPNPIYLKAMEKPRSRISLVLSLIFLLCVLTGLWQRQAIYDWMRLNNYQPPASIVALADATTMNDYGRKIFYVTHPVLENKEAFNQHCTNSEKSIVLGCYIERQGIYVFDVQDPRLNGIEEVTAAHEMLHAAYDRLSSRERMRIDGLTQQALDDLKDQRVIDTVKRYRERDPSIVPNELHSIIGTEVRNISPELETYYRKYFTDRSKIVGYSEQYQQAFTERQAKIDGYDKELKSLQQQIDDLQNSLELQEEELTRERSRLDNLRASGDTAAYNASVSGFNERVRRYNGDVNTARRLIDEYNRVVNERNALATEENELIKAIDSRPGTLQTE